MKSVMFLLLVLPLSIKAESFSSSIMKETSQKKLAEYKGDIIERPQLNKLCQLQLNKGEIPLFCYLLSSSENEHLISKCEKGVKVEERSFFLKNLIKRMPVFASKCRESIQRKIAILEYQKSI